jgi:ethanolaminephosphotransferase
VLTLLGLICNILAYVVVAIYTPWLIEAAPRWTYIVSAILIFTYQVLDNVDGKQARRTRSSSPLGELFDHGCDALSVVLFALIGGSTLRIGGDATLWLAIAGFIPFYLAHWEEYHTGSLVLGQFNGPTEAQLVIIAVLLVTGIVGPWLWAVPLGHSGLAVGFIPFILTVSAASFTVIQNILKVVRRRETEVPIALFQLLPITAFVILSIIWILSTPSALSGWQFHFAMNTLGVIFAYLVSRLIVNRICREPVKLFHLIIFPLGIVSLMGLINVFAKKQIVDMFVLMAVLFTIASALYLYFAVSVVIQLATHLNIRVFKIPYPPPPPQAPSTAVSDAVMTDQADARANETAGLLRGDQLA